MFLCPLSCVHQLNIYFVTLGQDVLNEIERNLGDAMQVIRNVVFEPVLLPGGGATEMAVGQALARTAHTLEGVQQWPYAAAGKALEVMCCMVPCTTLFHYLRTDVVRVPHF